MTVTKALTVAQPWAALIAHGIKGLETRPAPPNGPMRPEGVRGLPGLPIDRGERVAIHAAAKKPTTGADVGDWYWEDTAADPECIVYAPLDRWEQYPAPTAAVVATVVVIDALPIIDREHGWQLDLDTPDSALVVDDYLTCVSGDVEDDLTDELPLGDYTPGRWAWVLDDVQRLAEPIPCRGAQGVWRLPQRVVEALP